MTEKELLDTDWVTTQELIATGFCAWGVKRWFDERGYDFRKIISDGGLTVGELRKHMDYQCAKVLENVARNRSDKHGQQ